MKFTDMAENSTTEVAKKSRKSNPNRGAKPGERRGGRSKGTPNKTTKAVKEALQEAFDGLGGVASLQAWASEEPGEFYKLWAKLLPTEVKATHDGGIQITVATGVPESPEDKGA